MNFGFTEEQQQLRQAARRFLDERCPITEVRRIMQTDSGYDETLWREIADLGWLGLTIPEEYGGSGLSWIDAIVVLEESGRSLFPSPLISTLLAGSVLEELGNEEQKRRWLPGIADGSIRGSVALFEADCDVLDPAAIASPRPHDSISADSTPDSSAPGESYLHELAARRYGGDTERGARDLLDAFRKGTFGAIALERPPEPETAAPEN